MQALRASQVHTPLAAGLLGLSFYTEGAIPYAARDPVRVVPAKMLAWRTLGR